MAKAKFLKNSIVVFDNAVKERFEPVQQEFGWKIIINGVWMQKRDNHGMKRYYASENAAKDRATMELVWHFDTQFQKEYSDLYEAALYQNRTASDFGITEWYALVSASRAAWIRMLHKEGILRYEEVKP